MKLAVCILRVLGLALIGIYRWQILIMGLNS